MKLYRDFLVERYPNKDLIWDEKGFISYEIRPYNNGMECYIEDLYIDPKHRRNGHAYKLADEVCEIAKEAGCNVLTATVIPSAKGTTQSELLIINYGMNMFFSEENAVWYKKDL